ncbi:MAG: Jag N-terminal domain-containing protein [bacterium]
MKSVSVFGEGSNILDAIKKAWEKAGQPDNFTVKIITFGKKGFLGFWAKPAVVSLFCKLKKDYKNLVSPREIRKDNKQEDTKKTAYTQIFKKGVDDVKSSPASISKKLSQGELASRKTKDLFWNDELIQEISQYCKQLFNIMEIETPFKVDFNKKILNISLKNSVLTSKEEEKSFYISLSHILMQFLKKDHKKKFEGFHIIINSPLVANESTKQN